MRMSDTTQAGTSEAFVSVVGGGAFSLEDILARGVAIHWDEAVAVVEELCAALTIAPEKELPVPELDGILISNDGAVVLASGRGGTKGAGAAGRTLHALLSTANVPVAVRLFVTQASSADRYSSIRDFAAALAYYGKPGRAELIRAIYQRCVAPGVASATRPRDRQPAPPITSEPDDTTPGHPQQKARAWAPVAVAVIGVLGAGTWLWSTMSGRPGEGSAPSLMTQAKSAIQELGTEVRDVLGVGVRPVLPGGGDAATSPLPQASRPRVTRSRADARVAVVAPNVTPLTSRLDPAPFVTVAHPDAPAPSSVPMERAREPEQSIPVYSSADLDVRPPLLLHPQLPPPLVDERRARMVNTMELVVSESGTVLQVRLIDGPRRMPDMMLLSGAKMWRFQPAVKDSEAVRYRTVVSWSGLP
jgi:hypothetical protein